MKQIRLSQSNIELLLKLECLTSDQMNSHIAGMIRGYVQSDVQSCTQLEQKQKDSFLPLLLRLVEAQEVIAASAGCVGQRTLSENVPTIENIQADNKQLSDKQMKWVDDLFIKTTSGISKQGDWETSEGDTRNLLRLYKSIGGPADLYCNYVRLISEWLIDNYPQYYHLYVF